MKYGILFAGYSLEGFNLFQEMQQIFKLEQSCFYTGNIYKSATI